MMNALDKLKENLSNKGWEFDRFGNAKKTLGDVVYRVKFQKISVRVEREVLHEATEYSPASKSWIKIAGAYNKDLKILDGGKVKIGNKMI